MRRVSGKFNVFSRKASGFSWNLCCLGLEGSFMNHEINVTHLQYRRVFFTLYPLIRHCSGNVKNVGKMFNGPIRLKFSGHTSVP